MRTWVVGVAVVAGAAACGGGRGDAAGDGPPADAASAPPDAGRPISGACGNEVCDDDEACGTCAGDCGPCATGTVFYVRADGDDAAAGTSDATAWATLGQVEHAGKVGTIGPGDSVLFRKGDTFVGTLTWDNYYGGSGATGAAGLPLTFASYGQGAKPVFLYPPITPASPPAAERRVFTFLGGEALVLDGLDFTDPTFDATDKLTPANTGIAIQLGVFDEAENDHCVVQNCDFGNIGMGVVIHGTANVVDHNTFTDLKNLVDTACADPRDTGFCSYEDYGANGVTISGNDNVVTHNYFAGNWAHSYDFVFNGGAVEAYGGTLGLSRNRIMFNTVTDCNGVMEIGSSGDAVSADNLLAYNLFIDNGMLTWVSLSGVFATDTTNVQYFNNTVVETPGSRFIDDGSTLGASSGPTADGLFNVRNNIFYLRSGADVVRAGADAARYVHDHNVFALAGGDVNLAVDGTEIATDAPLFVDTSGADPLTWDYHLRADAPGVGAGADLGFTVDLEGTPVGAMPTIGAFQAVGR